MSANKTLEELCHAAQLNFSDIRTHQTRLRSYFSGHAEPYIKVLDTCRIDNEGIVKFENLQLPSHMHFNESMAAFIPAAGASTRYFDAFKDLAQSAQNKNFLAFKKAQQQLIQLGALHCHLLQNIRQAFFEVDEENFPRIAAELLMTLALPKALQQYKDQNYIEHKIDEHRKLGFLEQEIYIINPEFQEHFNKYTEHDAKISFAYQGPDLSTIRFDDQAEPILVDGEVSPVPAGHGTLTKVMSQIKKEFSHLSSVFIRNIDNTPDFTDENFTATRRIAEYFSLLRNNLVEIRTHLAHNDFSRAEQVAESILAVHQQQVFSKDQSSLKTVLEKLFHLPSKELAKISHNNCQDLLAYYRRPLNILGQVPNLGKDIGGSPAFVKTEFGIAKLCIELPHASDEDQEIYLKNPKKMTHFNPVFVFSELMEDSSCYELVESPFWIIAKKSFQNKTVYYHETVLYELLGNSMLANAIFIEIPRSLFRPNKSIFDYVNE